MTKNDLKSAHTFPVGIPKMSQNFDLNLLKVLDTLLEEKSVTKAADRLCVTQSAVSKNLNKLRQVFDDDILVRNGKYLVATPKAVALGHQLKPILQNIIRLTAPDNFIPELCDRRFKFDMMEVTYAFTLPNFMPELLAVAPDIKLETKTWSDTTMSKLQNCEIDFAIRCLELDTRSKNHISSLPPQLNYAELSRDHATCVVRNDHPILRQGWTKSSFIEQKHIQVTGGGNRHWLLDEILMKEGLGRNIVIEMPDFHGAFQLCERSDLVLCTPYKQVENIIDNYDLTVMDIPIDMKDGAYVLIWNRYFDQDPAHQWLREFIQAQV